MKKKLFMFSILTVLLFILSAIPVLADDAGDFKVDKTGNFKYELSEVGLKITSYEGSEKDVVIPNEIDGYKVSAIGKHAFKDNTTMTSVVIPEGVSNIYMEAFYGCSALSRIEFNAKNCTVTGVNTYSGNTGAGVFSGAGSASPNGLEVIFGDKVTKVPENLFDTASLDEGAVRRASCQHALDAGNGALDGRAAGADGLGAAGKDGSAEGLAASLHVLQGA